MIAGYYKNVLCYGESLEKFKIVQEEEEKFISSAEANFDVFCSNIKIDSQRFFYATETHAKKFLLKAQMSKNLLLKEIYKKYEVDLYTDEEAFSFLFFLMAIRENERRKIAAKRHILYLGQKAKRAMQKIKYIQQLEAEVENENEFNFNNYSFLSAIRPEKIEEIKHQVHITDIEFLQFEQVFTSSVFYIHKQSKKLWYLVDEYLIPLDSTDYIKKEK